MNELLWPLPAPLPPGHVPAVVVCVLAAVVLWIQNYPLSADAWRRRLAARGGSDADALQASSVLAERAGSAVLLAVGGVAGWLAIGEGAPGWLGLPRPGASLVWAGLTLALILPIIAMSARKPAMWNRYPEIRAARWTRSLAGRSLASSALYLLGYEVFFRGLLTFGLVSAFGVWPGLAAMTAIYVVAHLRKDASETFACVPMGFAFGMMALQTGSIWAPWLVHVVVAWTNEVVSARLQPNMDYPHATPGPL